VTEVATTVAPTRAPAADMLADIVVKKPQHSDAKTKKYLCSIRKGTDASPLPWDHLDFQIGVGPACFGRRSFVWQGQGVDAQQVFFHGMIAVLTDDQVKEVKTKLQFEYARFTYSKKGVLTGVKRINSSNSGMISVDPVTRAETILPPREVAGRTVNGDVPLKDLLDIKPVYEDTKIIARYITVEEARETIRLAEAEAKRELEGNDATFGTDPAREFETGKGGKLEEKSEAQKRAEAALEDLSKSSPQISGAQDVMVRQGGKVVGGPRTKDVSGGAGRLPEGK